MHPTLTAIVGLFTLAASIAVRADVYELKEGGEVVGTTTGRTEEGNLLIRTAEGAEITLDHNLLQRVVQQDEAVGEYRRRSRAAADTADAHRDLAAWCREHKLLHEADHHLVRVAELDPEDEASRRSLGYLRVGDRWLTSDEIMVARGLQFYDGKYRTPQDVAIRERDKEQESVNIDWFARIRLWRTWLDNRRPERVIEAQTQIMAINDPQAAPALVRLMADEPHDDVFEMFLKTLGQLDHPIATRTMVSYTLDPEMDPEIRAQCRDYLIRGKRPVIILPYVQALKSKDNVVVNLAGLALGQIGDPAAISPLIDALVTTHKYTIQPAGGGGGQQINAGFSPTAGGGAGLSMGGNGPQIITKDESNEKVHQALMKLSGKQNFEFDEPAWRAWFVDMQMRQHVNARRDQ